MGTAAFFPETIAGEEPNILMVRMKPVTSQLNSLKKSWSSNLKKVKDVRPGKLAKKRKREDGQRWDRRSCLWDLPYWADMKLRHNLDVMHIEKNI